MKFGSDFGSKSNLSCLEIFGMNSCLELGLNCSFKLWFIFGHCFIVTGLFHFLVSTYSDVRVVKNATPGFFILFYLFRFSGIMIIVG